jgi:hypothetical protein
MMRFNACLAPQLIGIKLSQRDFMKKLNNGLAILALFSLSGLTFNTLAALPAGTSRYLVNSPTLQGGLAFGITLYSLQPSAQQLDYALFFPEFDSITQAPIRNHGEFKSIDTDYDFGYRLNIGYVFPCTSNDVVVAYTHFDNHNTDCFRNPTAAFNLLTTLSSGSPVNFINEPFAGPNEISFFDPEFRFGSTGVIDNFAVKIPSALACAEAKFEYQALDLELGQYMNVGCRTQIRWFAGLRYASLDNNIDAHYTGTGTALDVAVTNGTGTNIGSASCDVDADLHVFQESDFHGIGPRLGTHLTYYIANGFGIVGESSVSLLVGNIDRHLDDTLSFLVDGTGVSGSILDETLTDTHHQNIIEENHPNETRIVPNLEAKLGLNYSYQVCNCSRTTVTGEIGYMATHYWNSWAQSTGTELGHNLVGCRTLTEGNWRTANNAFSGPYLSLQIQI